MSQHDLAWAGSYSSPNSTFSLRDHSGGNQHGTPGVARTLSSAAIAGGTPARREPGVHTLPYQVGCGSSRLPYSSDITSRQTTTPTSQSARGHRVSASPPPCETSPPQAFSLSSHGSVPSHRSSVERLRPEPCLQQHPASPPSGRPRWVDLQHDGDGEQAFCLRSVVLGMEIALLSDRVRRCSGGVLDTAGERTWLSLLQAYNLYQRDTVDLLNHLLVDVGLQESQAKTADPRLFSLDNRRRDLLLYTAFLGVRQRSVELSCFSRLPRPLSRRCAGQTVAPWSVRRVFVLSPMFSIVFGYHLPWRSG